MTIMLGQKYQPSTGAHLEALGKSGARPAQTQEHALKRQTDSTSLLGNQVLQHLLRAKVVQAKLNVSQPGDEYEQEADRVAETVIRMPSTHLATEPIAPRQAQRSIQRACAECREDEEKTLQAQGLPGQSPATVSNLQAHYVAPSSAGQSLPQSTRSFFESRFGYDFNQVRIHTGTQAKQSARAVKARAYTLGRDVIFGAGEFAPQSAAGLRLLAHELTHVVQQSGGHSSLVQRKAIRQIARTPLDLTRVDTELNQGVPLTQTSGEIGHAAARQSQSSQGTYDPPTEETAADMAIEAYVYRRSPTVTAPTGGAGNAPGGGAAQTGGTTQTPTLAPADAGANTAPPVQQPDAGATAGQTNAPGPVSTTPPPPPPPPARALIIGGVHGNERGPLDVMSRLQTELQSASSPLARDFDTVVIPVMNPGGVADNTRENRRGVDLNRNFPGLSGFPVPPAGTRIPPEQPEVRAVRTAIQTLHPVRILALHAISGANKGGVYADPVEGPPLAAARELACRMALRMRGAQNLTTGRWSGNPNVVGNEVANNVCSVRYPETAAVSVTTRQSSLGSWASAPPSVGGQGTLVVTHEVADKNPLAQSGPGRSVDTIMPGIHEFLLDNGRAPSEADALLRGAVSDAFLTGESTTSADAATRAAIERIVNNRFRDMNAYYRAVWRPGQPANIRRHLPASLTMTHTRLFQSQANITSGALQPLIRSAMVSNSISDAAIETAILTVMQTRSMPGFSRHHWGTDIDVVSATRTDWEGSGQFVDLIPFFRDEAARFGFFHPYTSSSPNPSQRHYQSEPWHLSYWPIANVLQQEWASRITGSTLNNLIGRTARAIHGSIDVARMERILQGIGLTSFQTNVASSP
jgi:hypothetical protein